MHAASTAWFARNYRFQDDNCALICLVLTFSEVPRHSCSRNPVMATMASTSASASSAVFSIEKSGLCVDTRSGSIKRSAGKPCLRKSGGAPAIVQCSASSEQGPSTTTRRAAIVSGGIVAMSALLGGSSLAAPKTSLPDTYDAAVRLCDTVCESELEKLPLVTTASGLQYRDIVVGTGPKPPVGFQITVNYVAMTPDGRIFDSSLEKKYPYDIRVGAGQVVAGLDEGVQTMRVGGKRRLYVPGELAFPKGLSSAPGRPRVPPSSPVMFDVEVLLIPGLDPEDYASLE
eukprot:jgi/Mesvir1/10509/Mv15920-RA.1